MKITAFIATSLDGFIARKDGSLDWLTKESEKAAGEDYGYDELMASIDYLVMGRGCLETVATFSVWPYEGTNVIVLSRTMEKVPDALADKVELYNGSLQELLNRFQQEHCKGIYIDGGKTIQSFLAEGLVTDLIITKIPVLIGEGIPLFGKLEEDVSFRLVDAKPYASGLLRTHYRPAK